MLLHLRYNPEDDDSTYDGADEFTEPVHGLNAEQAEQPAAEHAAHDAQEEVENQSFSVTALQFAGDEAGLNTGDDSNDGKFHNDNVFRG